MFFTVINDKKHSQMTKIISEISYAVSMPDNVSDKLGQFATKNH